MNEPLLIKKKSITEKAIKKQKQILIVSILCLITLFVSVSYALLTNFDKTDNVITFQTGNLTMTVSDVTVNLNDKLPESDTSGLASTTPIQIVLTNTGTMNIEGYDVKLVAEDSTSNVTTLSEEYIKFAVSVDGTTYSTPSTLTANNNIIYSSYNLAINQSKTIYLKIWIDENAGNNAINKEYYQNSGYDIPTGDSEQFSYYVDATYQNDKDYIGVDRRYYKVDENGNKSYSHGENAYSNNGYLYYNYLDYDNVVKNDACSYVDYYNVAPYASSGYTNPFTLMDATDFEETGDNKYAINNLKGTIFYIVPFLPFYNIHI